MEDRPPDSDKLWQLCRAAIRGPSSSFTARPPIVSQQMKADGISLPAVATPLRQWAMRRNDVLRVALSCTPKRYRIAILLEHSQLETVRKTTDELYGLKLDLLGHQVDFCILGKEHGDSLLFHRYGTYVVHQVEQATSSREAA